MFLLTAINCSSPALSVIVPILKRILRIIQIISPIILIISLMITAIKMLNNPEDKKLPKRLSDSTIALVILFMLPTLMNVVMSLIDERTVFSTCWNNVEIKGLFQVEYIETKHRDKTKFILDPEKYQKADPVVTEKSKGVKADFEKKLNSMSTPSREEIASAAGRLGISDAYTKVIIGTAYNEGYFNDPYLYYGWASAIINTRPSMDAIYGWGGGSDFYSQEKINSGYINATPTVLKAVYLALTERNTKIVECDGMYITTPAGYNLLYKSSVYNCVVYERK